jgi:hypothetical protein
MANIKHFENIWESAEEIAPTDQIEKIKILLDSIDNPDTMGEVLFLIAGLSIKYKINVWAQLEKAIENYKVENYE